MTPPTHQGGPGGQQDQGHGVVLHDQGVEVVSTSVEEVCLYFLGGVPIQYFGLDPIDSRSSLNLFRDTYTIFDPRPEKTSSSKHTELKN